METSKESGTDIEINLLDDTFKDVEEEAVEEFISVKEEPVEESEIKV